MNKDDAHNLAAGTFRSALRLAEAVNKLLQCTGTREDADKHARNHLQNVTLSTRDCGDAVAADVMEFIEQLGNLIRSQSDVGLLRPNDICTLAQNGLDLLGADEDPPPVEEINELPTTVDELQQQCRQLRTFLASHGVDEESFAFRFARQRCRTLSEHASDLGVQLDIAMAPTETVDHVRRVLSAVIESCAKVRGRSSNNHEPSEPEFLFAPDGDGYVIRAFGESGTLTAKGCQGLHQIYHLIRKPGVMCSLLEVVDVDGDPRLTADKHSQQPVRDSRYRIEIAERRRKLEGQKIEAEKTGDPARIMESEDELEFLNKQDAADVGRRGKPRDLNTKTINSMDKSILGSLRRAISKMRAAQPPMNEIADDFKAAIDVSASGVTYTKVRGSAGWSFSRSIEK